MTSGGSERAKRAKRAERDRGESDGREGVGENAY